MKFWKSPFLWDCAAWTNRFLLSIHSYMQKKSAQKWRFLINSPIWIIYQFFINEVWFLQNELETYIKEIKTWKTPSKSIPEYYSSNDLERYKPQDIWEQMYLDETTSYISNNAVINKQATIYQPWTLLINCIWDIWRCAITTQTCSSNQQITWIKFKDNLLPEFVYYFFLCNSDKLQIESSSTTLAIINQTKLWKLKIKYIWIEKQKEIVAFLKHCNESIFDNSFPELEKFSFSTEFNHFVKQVFSMYYGMWNINQITEYTNILIKSLRQSILSDAIQGKLVPQDSTDEPTSELLKKIQAEKEQLIADKKIKKPKPLTPIRDEEKPFMLPNGWEWVRFWEVVYIKSNLVSPFHYSNHPHIAPDNIEKWTGKLKWYKTVLEDEVISSNHLFFPNQLIYSKVRPWLNKVVYVDFEWLCSADMYPLETSINIIFLQKCMLSQFFLDQVNKLDNRIKMPKINQDELNSLIIPLPPLAEQNRIVAKVDELMNLCDQLEARVNDAQQQGKLLMESVLFSAWW